MNFYGQSNIIVEMDGFVRSILGGENHNFLFTAPSGYGKTKLALIYASKIEPYYNKISYQTPDNTGNVEIDRRKRVHIIDECHLLTNPESLYPLMDSKKFTFFFMTNGKGMLKEALRNRCKQYSFSDYSVEEVASMVNEKLVGFKINMKKEMVCIIATEANLNPRVAVDEITERLLNLFNIFGKPRGKKELRRYIHEYLGITDGLNRECQSYIELLKSRKQCSIDLICSIIRLEKSYVMGEIEPILTKKGLLEITSKGRKYTG